MNLHNKGVGTFVSSKNTREIKGSYGFSELLRLREMKVSIDIISFKIIKSDNKISKKLDIKLGSEVYKFVRIYKANEVPTIHTTSWLPCSEFSDLDSFNLKNNSLYKIILKKVCAISNLQMNSSKNRLFSFVSFYNCTYLKAMK